MTNYKEILRLYCSGDYSQREIALALGISRNTVSKCIGLAREKRISLPVPEEITNQEIEAILFPDEERKRISQSYTAPDFSHLAEELKKPHVTKKLLWKEYVDSCKGSGYKPYGISQFNALLNEYASQHNISLRRDRNPGEVLELDWSGSSIVLHGKAPGLERRCHLFVAAFPFSGYFFAEAFADEKIHSWVKGVADSLSFFGGVPVILRPDNTKTATIKADRYEPELNTVMIELSEHYHTVTIPARARKPRDKNVVENSVGFVSTYIIAALRNQVFYSLDDMNNAVMEKVRQFQLFERARAKVAPDYHVQFDKCFYSVHPKHIGEEVRIKASADTVMILLPSGEEIARHPRGAFKGQRVTDSSHIPPMHQEILGWSGDSFRSEARRIGNNTHALIDRILSSRQYEVQSYKICRGVLNLRNRVGARILEIAAGEALDSGIISYKGIKAIAETIGMDAEDSETTDREDDSHLFLTHSTDKKEGKP